MTLTYFMDCGGCGRVIRVGWGKVNFQFYTCPSCGDLNYPMETDQIFGELED